MIFGIALPCIAVADDAWLARPYRIRLSINPPDQTVRDAVIEALGAACRVEEPADKAIDIWSEAVNGRVVLHAREADLWMSVANVEASEVAVDVDLKAATAARLAASVFRPRVLISRRNEQLQATVWGERLDPTLVTQSRWYEPYIRFHDRDETWRETRPIMWTFVRLGERTRLDRTLKVESALPQPIPGRVRRGQVVAVATPVPFESTTIRLLDSKLRRPRPGLRVEVRNLLEKDSLQNVENEAASGKDQAKSPPSAVLTANRRGEVTLPSAAGELQRIRVLTTTTIANVPIVPGAKETIDLPLADDIERVELEERLDAIESQLQTLVSRRSILIAKIRKNADEKNWAEVEATLPELDEIPAASTLLVALNAARVEAMDSALARGDRGLASLLRRKSARLEKTLATFSDPTLDDDFRDELETLRDIDENAKKIDTNTGS